MNEEFTQRQLMQLFLSVYTVQFDHDSSVVKEYEDKFTAILNKHSQIHEVTPYGEEMEKLDTQKLMDKLLSMIEEE